MPINAGPEYFVAERIYLETRTKEEKIVALQEMIRFLPKHKGTETQLALLKKRLAKLKSQKSVKTVVKQKFIIKKLGLCSWLTNSSKSSLLRALTDVSAKNKTGLKKLKEKIWFNLDLKRVYTKSPGKTKGIPPITLPRESQVRDVARIIHKDFIKNFKFVRIFNDFAIKSIT